MSASFSAERFNALPIVGILRGLDSGRLAPVVDAVIEGGLKNLEITMNTPDAAAQIRAAVERSGDRLNVGAGTVTTLERLDEALTAGASFVVTPTVGVPVIERCVALGVPVFPGAFSPSEALRAWELGAMMVKIFPAEVLGPVYIKNLKAPLPHLKLMPTGGVDLTTLGAYRKAGADGFGVGSPLFRPERLAANDWDWLRQQCRAFVEAFASAAITSPR